jgi:hypothetical protein
LAARIIAMSVELRKLGERQQRSRNPLADRLLP